MFKGVRTVQLYIRRLKPLDCLAFINKRTVNRTLNGTVNRTVNVQCRCLCLSAALQKKGKRVEETDTERLEREAPFLFKAINAHKHIDKDARVRMREDEEDTYYEAPILFQPIHVKKQILEDDTSHLGHGTPLSVRNEKVFVIQPDLKTLEGRLPANSLRHRLSEAEELIKCVHTWNVHRGCTEPVRTPKSRFFFGTGKVLALAETIREAINNDGVTMVFVNTERLMKTQTKELESAWGCKVFDRYRVVLELFKERARTGEAKLQVQLAEIQYMRTHLVATDNDDQQRAGESQLELSRRILFEKELKTKKALEVIKTHRKQLKAERSKKHVPHVAMVGYTNAGKTTLAKELSLSSTLIGEDKLFATLDTTVHRGRLPTGLSLVYVDTVGFITDLPHELVDSFAATLEDVKTADLLIHVADCSHPEFELQCATVENVLKDMGIGDELMENMITVHNKVDLRVRVPNEVDKNVITISATEGIGIRQLRETIEEKILRKTGRRSFTINLDLHGGELSWLYRHGTVVETAPCDNGTLDVKTILSESSKQKYEAKFRVKLD